jgi:eukaryotic-like serine/threonine-protein kinase
MRANRPSSEHPDVSATKVDSRMSPLALSQGPNMARIIGRYELHGALASGGMATVHLGRLRGEVGFRRTVAIKRLLPGFAEDPEFRAMLLEEARVAGRIQHPNVVHVIDVVDSPPELLLVMELVAGESLARLLAKCAKRGELIPAPIAVAIVMDLLEGLHAAHEATNEQGEPLDLVHRDISPQNVMVGADGVARVLDFGIAKATGRAAITREGQVKGKLAYMAPEQLDGNATRVSDIYAAGVILWEALTSRRLFSGETDQQVLSRMLTGVVRAPSELGAPSSLDQCTMQALSRNPNERFPTARSMAMELGRRVQPASPHEVAAWLEELAGEELAKNAERVAGIETAPLLEVPRSSPASGTDVADVRAAKPRHIAGILGAVLLGTITLGGLWFGIGARTRAAKEAVSLAQENKDSALSARATAMSSSTLPQTATASVRPEDWTAGVTGEAAVRPKNKAVVSSAPTTSGSGARAPSPPATRPAFL